MVKKTKQSQKSCSNKRIREGDLVFIIAGNDKGRTGKVLSRVGERKAIIEGINVKTKHTKASQGAQGGIVKQEAPFDLSNVRLCVDEKKPARVRVEISEEGQKDLIYTLDGEKKTYRTLSKSK